MKKWIAFLVALCLIISSVPTVLAAQYINQKEFYYYTDSPYLGSMSGGSSLKGYEGTATGYLSSNECILQPMIVQGGKYEVYFYNIPWSNNNPSPLLTVKDKNGIYSTQAMDHVKGTQDFYYLGTFEFSAGNDGYFKLSVPPNNTSDGYIRYNVVKYVLVEGYDEYVDVDVENTVPEYAPAVKQLETKNVELPTVTDSMTKIYVSKGTANGDGSQGKPFGTIQEAQTKVRQIISNGNLGNGIGVMIGSGTYEVDKTFTLGAQDSGTANAPIIYQAMSSDVVLTTGKSLSGSSVQDITDPDIINRLLIDDKSKIKMIDLAANGISVAPIKPNKSDWARVSIPDKMLIDNSMYSVSKYPNEGEAKLGTIQDLSGRGTNEQIRDKGSSFSFKELPRILNWTQEKDVIVNGKFSAEYVMESTMISNIDSDNMIISVLKGGGISNRPTPEVIFKNLLCEIDSPGEFYIDRQNQKLYFYPIDEIKPSSNIIFNFLNISAVKFDDGAQNIIFKGINIKMVGASGAEFAKGSSNCMFAGGEVSYTTDSGVKISGKNITVRDCNVKHIGTTGIECDSGDSLIGDKGNVLIENNDITATGEAGTTNMHGARVMGCGNTLRNNHIYDILGQGVLWGGIGILIENNLIERVCIRFTDAGAIYTAATFVQDSIIRNNIIRDVLSEEDGTYNRGIYLDQGTIGTVTIEGNIIKNADSPFTFTSTRSTIKNNLIIMDDSTQGTGIGSMILGGRLEQASGKTPTESGYLKRFDANALKTNYPLASDFLLNGIHDTPTDKKAFNNVFYNYKKDAAEKTFINQTTSSTFATNGGEASGNLFLPGKPTADDFSDVDWAGLAAQNGFEQIPVKEIGLYKGGMREDQTLLYVKNRVTPFKLYYPENGAKDLNTVLKLEWDKLLDMGSGDIYLYIAENETFTDNLKIFGIKGNSIEIKFDPGKTYYWTVKSTPTYCEGSQFNEGMVYSFSTKSHEEVLEQYIVEANTLVRNTVEGNSFLQYKAGSKSILSEKIKLAENTETGTVEERLALLSDAIDVYLKSQSSDSKLSTILYEDFSNDVIGDRSLSFYMRNAVKDTPALVNYESNDSNNKVTRIVSDLRTTQAAYNVQTEFPNQKGYIEAYASVMMETAGISASMQVMASGVDTYTQYRLWERRSGPMVVFSKDGKIYSDFNKDYPSMSFEVGKWYDVAIKANVATREYDVYINGELLASKVPFIGTLAECEDLGALLFSETEGNTSTRNTQKGSFSLDNLIVRAPLNYGYNNFLNSIEINGQKISGFDQLKYSYEVDMTKDELANAVVKGNCSSGARASVYDYNGKKYISVISANQNDIKVYALKATK